MDKSLNDLKMLNFGSNSSFTTLSSRRGQSGFGQIRGHDALEIQVRAKLGQPMRAYHQQRYSVVLSHRGFGPVSEVRVPYEQAARTQPFGLEAIDKIEQVEVIAGE